MFLPTIFISYSHADRQFVAKLASDLLKQRIRVWWDEWEIKVGDSLLQKIQEGISTSSYLGVVLSPNSVNSAWVQEELNTALVRQLKEKRVVVLPILLQDCQIPPFLMDKFYADFRTDYESGLANLVRSLEPPNTQSHGRGNIGEYYNDYAFEWGKEGERHALRAVIASHSPELPYVVNCLISVTAIDQFAARLNEYEEAGFPWAIRSMMLISAEEMVNQVEPIILIQGDQEARAYYKSLDPKRGPGIEVEIRARRLGPDPGSDLLYEWGSIFKFIADRHHEGIKSTLHPSELDAFKAWVEKHPGWEAE